MDTVHEVGVVGGIVGKAPKEETDMIQSNFSFRSRVQSSLGKIADTFLATHLNN